MKGLTCYRGAHILKNCRNRNRRHDWRSSPSSGNSNYPRYYAGDNSNREGDNWFFDSDNYDKLTRRSHRSRDHENSYVKGGRNSGWGRRFKSAGPESGFNDRHQPGSQSPFYPRCHQLNGIEEVQHGGKETSGGLGAASTHRRKESRMRRCDLRLSPVGRDAKQPRNSGQNHIGRVLGPNPTKTKEITSSLNLSGKCKGAEDECTQLQLGRKRKERLDRKTNLQKFALYFTEFFATEVVEKEGSSLHRERLRFEFESYLKRKLCELEHMGITEKPYTEQEISTYASTQAVGMLLVESFGHGRFKVTNKGYYLDVGMREEIGSAMAAFNIAKLCAAWETKTSLHSSKVISYPEGCVQDWHLIEEDRTCLVFDFEVTRYWPEGGKSGRTKNGLLGARDRFIVVEASVGIMYAGVGIGPVCVIHPQQPALDGRVHLPTVLHSYMSHGIPSVLLPGFRKENQTFHRSRGGRAGGDEDPPLISHGYLNPTEQEFRMFCEAHVPRPTLGRVFADDPRLEMEVLKIFRDLCRTSGRKDGEQYWNAVINSLADITQVWAEEDWNFHKAPTRKQQFVSDVKEMQKQFCYADDVCGFHNLSLS